MKTPRQLALQARVAWEISVVDHGVIRYSFVTIGNRWERRYAQLRAATIARDQYPQARIYFRRHGIDG